jgi:hypothetical protein
MSRGFKKNLAALVFRTNICAFLLCKFFANFCLQAEPFLFNLREFCCIPTADCQYFTVFLMRAVLVFMHCELCLFLCFANGNGYRENIFEYLSQLQTELFYASRAYFRGTAHLRASAPDP